jgi:hypothetical protein
MSGHVQVRLPPLASHRQRGREPFIFGRKIRKHDVGLRVLASALAGWMATLQLRDSCAPQQILYSLHSWHHNSELFTGHSVKLYSAGPCPLEDLNHLF